ncbi:hypothetical protein V1477_009314 [Vespula maculifrons]|uniref:Uncharacterized protein n=1 Tax=Vespula maculifrons TaxID=7453 RepID=A0ABD2CA41_VESMC
MGMNGVVEIDTDLEPINVRSSLGNVYGTRYILWKISTLPQGRRDRSVLWISTLRFTQVSDGQQQSLRDLGNRNWNALLKIDTYTKSDDTDKHSYTTEEYRIRINKDAIKDSWIE